MWRRGLIMAVLLGVCISYGVLAGQPEHTAAVGSADENFKPVAPLISLMYAQDLHYARLNAFLVDESEKERAAKVRNEALTLAELANVNRFHKNKADYRQWADEVRGSALELAAAAAGGEFAKAKELSKRINNSCTACHKQYQ
jgi:hypothetical protein